MSFLDVKEILDICLSGILVATSIILSYYTYRLVDEARKTRKSQNQPYISLYLEQSEADITLMNIIVENTGPGPAYNLSFDIKKKFETNKNPIDIGEIGIFKRGLTYCAVGFKKKYFLMETRVYHEEKMKLELEIKATYQNAYNDVSNELFFLKPIELSKSGQIDPPDSYIGRIAKSLDEIKKILQKNNL